MLAEDMGEDSQDSLGEDSLEVDTLEWVSWWRWWWWWREVVFFVTHIARRCKVLSFIPYLSLFSDSFIKGMRMK
jgi:hypothetical protein